MKEGRRQGRQKKRREDIIREWTGLEFANSRRAVENRRRKTWRKLVVMSPVLPPTTPAIKEQMKVKDL